MDVTELICLYSFWVEIIRGLEGRNQISPNITKPKKTIITFIILKKLKIILKKRKLPLRMGGHDPPQRPITGGGRKSSPPNPNNFGANRRVV